MTGGGSPASRCSCVADAGKLSKIAATTSGECAWNAASSMEASTRLWFSLKVGIAESEEEKGGEIPAFTSPVRKVNKLFRTSERIEKAGEERGGRLGVDGRDPRDLLQNIGEV